MTKIAVSCEEPSLDSVLDPRFGRAAGFLIVEPETWQFEYIQNGAAQTMAQGAGIAAAEAVVRAGATVVLTGFVGPKAFAALSAAGVKVGQNLENLSVREAIGRYNAGDVDIATQSNRSRGRRG